MYYKGQSKEDYQASLDLEYRQGRLPLSIYTQLNGKPSWYNLELAHQEIKQKYEERKKQEAFKRMFDEALEKEKQKYMKQWEAEAKAQFDKEVPKQLDRAMKDLFKGLK